MSSAQIIYYGDREVGEFGLSPTADYYVEYSPDWQQRGFPLSVHLPLEQKRHEGKAVEYFVENLLPEAELRQAIARRHGISENNYFSMMEAIGRDCAGAFSIGAPQSAGHYEKLDKQQLTELLRGLPQYPLAINRPGASFSLAGAQNKIPLRQQDGEYYLPLNGAASNCIIKTPMQHAANSVPNELFCMRLGSATLNNFSNTEYLSLGSVSSLVVHRYDRHIGKSGLIRQPQEDFCQLAGLPSRLKYESEGGPGFADCAKLIRQFSSVPAVDLMRLMKWPAFNLSIGNMDAHAKNLSLLTTGSRKVLAPFYDTVCTLYYDGFSRELAMSIGGRRNPDKIGLKQWEQFAADIGIPAKLAVLHALNTIRSIIDSLPAIENELVSIVPQQSFIKDLKKSILSRCLHLLRKMR